MPSELNRRDDESMEQWLARLRGAAQREDGVASLRRSDGRERSPTTHMPLRSGRLRSSFGARLRAYREGRGWRQEDLAREAGCGHNTILNLETGVVDAPRVQLLERLADLFGVTMDELWRGSRE